ncbi:MAG TPA: molybdopterin cofactor-binding domain-containing protein [Planctomycetaceae bacterium]|nr:molybdopterin cofactor-binding domain-containing protein [Planctomycetaceae bacterium]
MGRGDFEPGCEPERYELDAPPAYRFDVDRRGFLQLAGGGLAVAFVLSRAAAQESGRRGRSGRGGGGRMPQEISAWLHIGEDGAVTIYTGKAEVGQNIRTSLAQVVAEELTVPLDSVRLVMADTELTPYDAGTFGSRTTPAMARQLRQVSAAARELLIDRAAETWNADRSLLTAAEGKIVHRQTSQSVGFAELTKGQKLTQAVSDDAPTKPADRWQVAGTSAPKASGRDFVTGRHRYSTDISLPGMLHGRVLRPAAFGATLESVDMREAEALPDVTLVRDGDFIGVAAPTEQAATDALDAIKAEWKRAPQVSAGDLFDHLRRTAGGSGGGGGGGGGRGSQRAGSIEEGLAVADVQLRETYTVAYIAHVPLEPRAAVAQWENGKLTVWTGTQRPFGVRSELAAAFRIPEDRVRVIVPDTGSGYGGKHTGEAAVEAARLARAAGKPVKLVWTREEELTWAYFRPAGVIDVTSGVRKDGTLTAWEFHNYNSGGSAIRTLYEVPNQRIEFHSSRSPLRQGSYRALASTANVFARETHMDELAHAVGIEPLEFRLKNLKDARFRAVLEAAAREFGWERKPAAGHGYGIGGGFEKGSYVATCAEVAVDRATGRTRVVRATSAFECGAVVNPEHLKNQVEGCMVMGLGGALFERIEFENGRITNAGFSGYRVPRFSDMPEINVVLLDRKDLPSEGAGETPIVGIAPAVGNAIFAATGVRLRSLPLAPEGVRV